MKFRTTIVLLVTAAALVAYYYTLGRPAPPSNEEIGGHAQVFAGTAFRTEGPGEVRTLTQLAGALTLSNKERSITLRRAEDGRWRIVEPRALPADEAQVSGVLGELELLESWSTVRPRPGETLDLAVYGLNDPAASVTVEVCKPDAKPASYTLAIGAATPIGPTLYAKRADENVVFVVPKTILPRLTPDLNALRGKSVMSFDPAAATGLRLDYANDRHAAVSRGPQGWRMTEPVHDLGDDRRIEALLQELAGLALTTADFVVDEATDEQLTSFGLSEPQLRVTASSGSQEIALLLGKPCTDAPGKQYARRADERTVFRLSDEQIAPLAWNANNLRCKSALPFDIMQVHKVGIRTPEGSALLTEDKKNWMVAEPVAADADNQKVSRFLLDLQDRQVTGWADEATSDLSPYGLAQPLATITLFMQDGATRRLDLGTVPGQAKELYARRDGSGAVLRLDPSLLQHVFRGYLAFLLDQILAVNRNDLLAVTVERADGERALVRQGPTEAGWVLTKPIQAPADALTMKAVEFAASFIAAEQYVAVVKGPQELVPYGLDRPFMKVAIEYQPAPAKGAAAPPARLKKTVLVGAPYAAGGRYATTEDGNLVFVINDGFVRQFSAEFASRSVCTVDTAQANALDIKQGQTEMRFERLDLAWRQTRPDVRAAFKGEVEGVLSLLGDLRAAEIAAYAAPEPSPYGLAVPAAEVTLTVPTKTFTLRVGRKEAGFYYVSTDASPFVYRVNEHDVAALLMTKEAPASP